MYEKFGNFIVRYFDTLLRYIGGGFYWLINLKRKKIDRIIFRWKKTIFGTNVTLMHFVNKSMQCTLQTSFFFIFVIFNISSF